MTLESNNQNGWRANFGMVTLIVSGILAVLGEVLARRYFVEWKLVSVPVHSMVEIGGAVLGVIVAVLLLKAWRKNKDNQKYIWISSALLAMAIVDIFHASVGPGSLFVWLHSMAMLIGGSLFVFVCLPDSLPKMKIAIVPIVVVIISAIFGVVSVMYPDAMPLMVDKGQMTELAKNINIAAGVLFLIAGVRLMVFYMDSGMIGDILFVNFCMLSAIAALFFFLSSLWNADWWFWHVVRLWGFVVTLSVWLIAGRSDKSSIT